MKTLQPRRSDFKPSPKPSAPLLGISAHKKTDRAKGTPKKPHPFSGKTGVVLYPHGVTVVGRASVGGGGPGGKRGKISNWTAASRRRMREFCLTHGIPGDLRESGVTLTIPGPPLPSAVVSRLWNHFQVAYSRAGACAVWRREVQIRGSVHWHLWAGLPPAMDASAVSRLWLSCLSSLGTCDYHRWVRFGRRGRGPVEGPDCSPSSPAFFASVVVERIGSDGRADVSWLGGSGVFRFAADSLPPVGAMVSFAADFSLVNVQGRSVPCWRFLGESPPPPGWPSGLVGCAISSWPDLSYWPGAFLRAVDVQWDTGGAWHRYLQDHASKCKQEQIADAGRHWGIVSRRSFVPSPSLPQELTYRQFVVYNRLLRRLRTRAVRCPHAPFGRRLRPPPVSAYHIGQRVYFGLPSTQAKLIPWIIENYS